MLMSNTAACRNVQSGWVANLVELVARFRPVVGCVFDFRQLLSAADAVMWAPEPTLKIVFLCLLSSSGDCMPRVGRGGEEEEVED